MISQKNNTSESYKTPQAKPNKRRSFFLSFRFWFVFLLVTVIVLAIVYKLLQTPEAFYQSPEKIPDEKYLTHYLAPEFYNGVQRGEPFSLPISQRGANAAISSFQWPLKDKNVQFDQPRLFFENNLVTILCPIQTDNLTLIATFQIAPSMTEDGKMLLDVQTVRVGELNITPVAIFVGRQLLTKACEEDPSFAKSRRAATFRTLLYENASVDPVIEVDKNTARISNLKIKNEEVIIHFIPVN